MMKNKLLIFFLLVFSYQFTFGNEPFVVLEYRGNFSQNESKKIDKNNKFLRDQNHSVTHKVASGESLSEILDKYYGNTGLNMRVLELSIIEVNKHAFVRNNPHFLFAGKNIKIPSINEIMNLVRQKPGKTSTDSWCSIKFQTFVCFSSVLKQMLRSFSTILVAKFS